jgi:branched-chain amino acid transport system ATP-binding protein
VSFLTVSELDVYYARLHAVRAVSFQVERGQLVAFLGANGAGKTSVVRALAGLVPVSCARMTLDGRRLDRLRPDQRVRLGMATVPEGRDLFRTLTVDENLRMGAYSRRDAAAIRHDLAWIYDRFPALGQKRRAHAGTLSGGQGQMLAIGRALMANPRLLLLDEPSHGLAPNLVDEIFRLIPQLQKERDLTIILVEQNANKALTVASYGYVLEAGSLELQGPTADLADDPRVKQLYLGG